MSTEGEPPAQTKAEERKQRRRDRAYAQWLERLRREVGGDETLVECGVWLRNRGWRISFSKEPRDGK